MLKGSVGIFGVAIAGTVISLQLRLFETVLGQVHQIQSVMDWGVQTATTYGSTMGI